MAWDFLHDLVCFIPVITAADMDDLAFLQQVGAVVVIVSATAPVELLEPQSGKVTPLPLELNPLRSPVTAMEGQEDSLWFATDGAGLIGANVMTHEWMSSKSGSQTDLNLAALAADGRAVSAEYCALA